MQGDSFFFCSMESLQSKWLPICVPLRVFFLLPQDRHSVVKRGEGESPPSTSPDDINQTFKFSPGDGQALQV